MTIPAHMQRSPLDARGGQKLVQLGPPRLRNDRWVPSRFNARAVDPNGRLIVWNTYLGSLSVFEPRQRETIETMLSQAGFQAEEEGIVKYLVERGYLVPRGTDERHRLQYTFGQQHYRQDVLQLILLASEDCNFRCVYCYEDFARGTMQPEVRQGVRALVAERAAKLKALQVNWFGGEPLYGLEAIEEIAPYCLELTREYGIAYHSHMTTNAYLMTPEVAEKLLSWEIRSFQITIDGMAEDHNQKRRARDGSGTWEQIVSNLRALRDRRDEKFSVTIRINFDQDNHPNMEPFLALLGEEFGADDRFQLAFHSIGRWGGENDGDINACGFEESQAVRKRLRDSARDKQLNVGRGIKDNNRVGTGVCYAARPFNFIVGASGKLMKCTVALDKHDYNVVGHLSPEGKMELDPDKLALWTQPAFQNDSGCAACYLVPVCQGMSCPMIRIEEDRRPCPGIKRSLKSELVATLELEEHRARQMSVTRDAIREVGAPETEAPAELAAV